MTMDVHSVLPPASTVFKPDILEGNGKLYSSRNEFPSVRNGYHGLKSQSQQPQQHKIQSGTIPGFSFSPACACLLMFDTLARTSWVVIRTGLVVLNHCYCIPTYTLWMLLLLPLRIFYPRTYWNIEGRLFHWLLSMVTWWSSSAGYQIMESGDRIEEVVEQATLVLSNHQSTSDVPLLMAAFNTRKHLLPNLNWIMDNVFKFTNFGIVSSIHGDFFVLSGKDARERTILELSKYLKEVFIPRKRKWIVLFPEGGFLHKRRAVSQRYAEKNKLPHFQYVTVPRMGAAQAILDEIGPQAPTDHQIIGDSTGVNSFKKSGELKYILDITIGYPNGEPLDILAVVSGYMRPCQIHFHYRLFPIQNVPTNAAEFQNWLLKIYQDKEKMLHNFYETGKMTPCYETEGKGKMLEPVMVEQDLLRMIILHVFFILSTLFHWTIIRHVYSHLVLPW